MNATIQQPTDRELYEYHSVEMQRAFKEQRMFDFEHHWQEVETIKNRNGGMPPKQP